MPLHTPSPSADTCKPNERDRLLYDDLSGGQPLTRSFYDERMSGMSNERIVPQLLPDWPLSKQEVSRLAVEGTGTGMYADEQAGKPVDRQPDRRRGR